jgi:hypothetical protein
MKTTIDMANLLFRRIKALAAKRNTTFKEIVEMALRAFLDSQEGGNKPFRLKKHAFDGKGLSEELSGGDWSEVRKRIYEGRGG